MRGKLDYMAALVRMQLHTMQERIASGASVGRLCSGSLEGASVAARLGVFEVGCG